MLNLRKIFNNELEFDRHITEKTNKAHSIYIPWQPMFAELAKTNI